MSTIIKIATIDRTSLIEWQSFRWQQALTSQVDTLSFSLKKHAGQTYKPALNDRVELLDGATLLFSGNIVDLDEGIEAGRLETIDVMVKDNTHEMDKTLVVRVYEDMDADDIIADIGADFLPAGYNTTTFVNAPVLINYVSFNYEQPSKCFQQLAELIGYDWYVDENKFVHFFAKDANTAPFDLTDTGAKYFFNTLKIHKSITNLRNSIFVRGGEFKGDVFTETEVADGEAKVFKQGFRYSANPPATAISVKKASVSQSVGVDNIDNPLSFDVLYNFQEKAVKFRDSNKPTSGQEVEVQGLPHIPVVILVREATSITQWAQSLDEGEFETKENGLRVGQQINVQSTIRNIVEDFIITRIESTLHTPTEMRHRVTLVSAMVFGMVEFLQKLLIQKDKEIIIARDEVLDKIESALEIIVLTEAFAVATVHNAQTEAISLSEMTTPQALDYPTVFVYAPFPVPTGFKRELALDGGVLS